jgi:serine phosphatase RsbU (regulator of sigma subunit)
MDARVVAASYQPSLLSIPPGIALSALLVVIAYASVVRGAAEMRGWFLLHSAALVPYLVTMVLAPSLNDAEVAATWFRISAAVVPLSAAGGVAFRLALIGRQGGPAGSRPLRFLLLGGSVAVAIPIAVTPWVVAGARPGALDVFFATPGPLAPFWLVAILLLALIGLRSFRRALRAAGDNPRRSQLRRMSIASSITIAATVDVAVAYGVNMVPMGWLLLGAGSVLALRALVLEDLLRVRAIDTRAPQLVLHLAGAVLLGWLILEVVGRQMPWWVQTLALVGAFSSIRVAIAVTTLVVRGARLFQEPRERLLAQFALKCRAAESEQDLDEAVAHVVAIAAEVPAAILVPSGSDWGWNRGTGERLDDSAAPDPLLVGWLSSQDVVFVDDPAGEAPPELRPSLVALFAAHRAQVILPLRSRDELLGLLVVGGAQPLPGSALRFISRAAERLSESLAHVRIVRQVRERAAISREVELAAQLQSSYLPTEAHRDLGRVRVAGIWRPATQCGGDFWAVYEVGAGRALVVIGDVTGHGVASAMVTAAVRGACDVTVRTAGASLELPTLLACLDAVVRRVGAERLHMSCLVALVDASAGEISYLSAGHAAPYLVRGADSGEADLEALVARGHPLGSGHAPPSKVAKKPIRPGDLLFWYTDGITEAQNRLREPFGDRRLQRLLRGLPAGGSPDALVYHLLDAVTAHRGEPTFDDDVTLVVARVREPDAPLAISGEATGRHASA